MDPRQRLLLQESWNALEDAGYGETMTRSGGIGMFVGVEQGDYQSMVKNDAVITSNHDGILAARLSYFLDLDGPAMAINTACSSGLVAAHQACQSLRIGECNTAIAAGVSLMLTPAAYIAMSGAGMLSETGRCHAFDARADGMVPGEAVAVVVLKRLSLALADGNPVYAVIRGSGINYDGKTNGITAPNGIAQTALLKSVYDRCRVNPGDIDYIVTHGTGTKLGDPVEINALYDAFKDYTQKQGYCALTSTKTNFGHGFAASGLVSLIALVQAIRHKTIPASLHCKQENDYINWKESPFFVNKTSRPWPGSARKNRIGAVSAFGVSGTNAHMVVESGPPENTVRDPAPYYLLTLSAKSSSALSGKIRDMIALLENKGPRNEDPARIDLARISYTLLEGRLHFRRRCAIVIRDRADAVHLLKLAGAGEKRPGLFHGTAPLNFTGQKVIRDYMRDIPGQSRDNPGKYKETLYALADLYCQGYEIPAAGLYGAVKPARISLPTYPFARKRYWAPENEDGDALKAQGGEEMDPCDETGGIRAWMKGISSSEPEGEVRTGAPVGPSVGTVMLAPVWDAIQPEKTQLLPAPTDRVLIVGGAEESVCAVGRLYPNAHASGIRPGDAADAMVEKLEASGHADHILWIFPHDSSESVTGDALIEDQDQGVVSMFRMIKALLGLGYGSKVLGWTLITFRAQPVHKTDPVSPVHSGVHGLAGSMAKEYMNWKIRLIDLETDCDPPFDDIFTLPADPRGNALVHRDGQWRRRQLIPASRLQPERGLYRPGGVYVVIGGAGAIGEAWTEYMIRNYNAHVIWIGRREKNADIQAGLDSLAALGQAPWYIPADATDRNSLQRAYDEIKKKHSRVNGVIHSAIILADQSLANMEEERFRAALSAKVDVSVRIAQVFQKESLDFILFFSSMQTFEKAPGQSNYAAGCTFKDAFAHRLSQKWPCAVKVMNWGYWGSIGIVASDAYRERMAKAGIGSIEPPEAMEALETLLAGPLDRIALLKTTKPAVMEEFNPDESIAVLTEKLPSAIRTMQKRQSRKGVPKK